MAVADLAHALEVAVLGDEAPAPVLDRLEDHRGDRLGALEHDRLLDRVGRPQRIAVLRPAVGVGVGHVQPPGVSGSKGARSGVSPVAVSAPIEVPW